METKTFKEFWRSLDTQKRDALRKELSDALFISTSTTNAYGCGVRQVPIAKQQMLTAIIMAKYNVKIIF